MQFSLSWYFRGKNRIWKNKNKKQWKKSLAIKLENHVFLIFFKTFLLALWAVFAILWLPAEVIIIIVRCDVNQGLIFSDLPKITRRGICRRIFRLLEHSMRKLKLFTIPHHVSSSISSVFTYKRIFSLAITIQYFCIEQYDWRSKQIMEQNLTLRYC